MSVTPESVVLFNALPRPYLLLSPNLLIEAVSDAYLRATLTQREHLVGQHLFDAFPDNPLTPEAQSVHNLRASLSEVLATGQPHEMAQQHYDVPDPTHPGQFVERHWQPLNTPVLNAQGQVVQLIHSVLDVTAEVRAQAHLRQSQAAEQAARAEAEAQRQRLHDILMQMPAQVATNRGPAHVFDLVNPRYQQQFPARMLQGLPVRQALPELASQHFFELLDHVYQTGEPFYGREMPAAADYTNSGQPEVRYFDVFFQALRDAQGRIDGVLNFAYDVTAQVEARRQVEQLNAELETRVLQRTEVALALQEDLLAAAQRQVREREELYNVFEQAPVVVALLRGPTHFWHYRNPAFQGLFPGRALTGRPYAEAMSEIVAAGLIPELDRVYATGQPYQGTALPVVTTPPDGSAPHQRYYDFSYQPYREEGRIVGISIFAYDVTEQVRAHQERAAQQRQLYAMFEQAPIGIAIQDGPDLVYKFHNPSYLWMVPDRQLVGKRFFDVFPEMAGTNVETLLRHVYETGETQQEHELLIPVARADGSAELEDRYFTIVYQARRDEQGRINGILAFVLEVTEQVRVRQQVQALNEVLLATNEELHASNAQLTRTNVDLDTFVYTASHDLKAPITNIESITLALRDTLPADVQQDEMIAHLLDLLAQTTTRFQLTIGQLTDLSKLQLAHAGPAEPVNLAAIIESVRLDVVPALTAANAQLTIEVAPDLVASFSPANLRSAIYNLLSNAVKYRAFDRPAQVRVRAFPAGPRVVLEVQDNGLGMSEVQQRQLFGLFQRLHTHVEGTGVGLYITKRLVENGGGTIAVQSQVDAGTTFTLTFPA